MAFASTANAGITIPAGDWTVDIGGNVNAYYTNKSADLTVNGTKTALNDGQSIGTGLLPAAFGIGAKTRQNDLDIAFQFSFFTGTASNDSLGLGAAGNNSLNIRQAFLTFGDASWGTIKAGRDLGIFGSDAILSDMTLLGVGVSSPASATAAGGSSTLGRIGSGYIYADWKGQISYASPNWNGFSFAAGVMENFVPATGTPGKDNMAFEGKVTYDFAANDVTGRVWVSGITQKTEATQGHSMLDGNYTSKGFDIGGKVAYQGAQLVGYYYDGEGLDSQPAALVGGAGGLFNGTGVKSEDSGGYVQATFVVPTIGTKLGASWGQNNSKYKTAFDVKNESWIIGAYHPLTKSLNLVAEYTNQEIKASSAALAGSGKYESDTVSLGAILFF